MNNRRVEKMITSDSPASSAATYRNPLVDNNVVQALRKSFFDVLYMSPQNSKVSNNLRLSVLENFRQLCEIKPENKMNVNGNISSLMLEAYEQKKYNLNNEVTGTSSNNFDELLLRNMKQMDINSSHSPSNEATASSNKMLDEFLLRNMQNMDISSHGPSVSPEVLQALMDLKVGRLSIAMFYHDLLQEIRKKNNEEISNDEVCETLRPEIEKIFLDVYHSLIYGTASNIPELFVSHAGLKNIVMRSSVSARCFQLSCNVLYFLYILTNFSLCIQTLTQTFVQQVKEVCPHLTISVLYPMHLSHVVIFLDAGIEEIPIEIRQRYCEKTIDYMLKIRSKSDTDFLMLLSHFPQWFDVIPQ